MSKIETISAHDARKPTAADRFVGQRMKLARRDQSLTQEGLASRLGVTFQQIQKYEAGHSRLSAGRLRDVAIALNRQISWFYEPFETAPDTGDAPCAPIVSGLKRDAHRLVDSIDDVESLQATVQVLTALIRRPG